MLFALCCILSACADVKVPTWLTGEPDDSIYAAPRVVSAPSPQKREGWPNLADVPEKKPVFTKQELRTDRTEELNSQRLQGQAEMERLRNIRMDEAAPAIEAPAPQEETPFSFSALRP